MNSIELPYRRTQIGVIPLIILVPPTLWVASIAARSGGHPVGVVSTLVLLFALAVFHSLTVRVDQEAVRVRFGMFPYSKSLPLANVASASAVEVEGRRLFGVRPIESGWHLTVSGRHALELHLVDGTVYRIGTDRPEELLAAVESARSQRALAEPS